MNSPELLQVVVPISLPDSDKRLEATVTIDNRRDRDNPKPRTLTITFADDRDYGLPYDLAQHILRGELDSLTLGYRGIIDVPATEV